MRTLLFLAPLACAAILVAAPARAFEFTFKGEPKAADGEGDGSSGSTDAASASDATAATGAGAPADPKAETKIPIKSAPGELPPAMVSYLTLPRVDIHGSAVFWYYQPIKPETIEGNPQSNLELYLASLDFTGRVGDFGLYLNPRFRDSEAREFFTSNVWVEEAYAFWESPFVSVKVGKLYQQFSRIWDDTFYGSLPYFDGFKLDSNYGLSIDGLVETKGGFGLGYYAQYFLLDGGTNGSLRDRDTVWVANKVHRNHTTLLRVEPSFRFNDKSSLRLGAAGEYTYVNFKTIPASNVFRASVDMSLTYNPVRLFAEYIYQSGQTALDYPIAPKPAMGTQAAQPGRGSLSNHYVLAGTEVQIGPVLARYAFSMVRYGDFPITEMLSVPGVTISVHENVSIMLEYAYWNRMEPGDKTVILDNSLNGIITGRF